MFVVKTFTKLKQSVHSQSANRLSSLLRKIVFGVLETNPGKVKLNKPSRSASSVERGQNSRLNIEIFAKSLLPGQRWRYKYHQIKD